MTNDRQITVTVGRSRRDTRWRGQPMMLSELWEKLRTPARGTETVEQYLALPKGQQDERKDVGGYVAGTLRGPRRKAGAVSGRDVITLDLDHIPAGGTREVAGRVDALGCGYCIYSTRKHRPDAPRLRVLFPLDRTCTADEYEPCARRMAAWIGMELADPSTFESSRLMYWPSVCADGQYVYYAADKPMLSVDGLLATYADWRDVTAWPTVPGTTAPARLAAKQGDPEAKSGVVGAFCRVYDVPAAMEAFLPGVYLPVDTMPGRFTFTGGSTTGGAVLYDNGKFLYSHHATDPCGGRLVNAFDLVRLHRFGDRDDDAQPGTPTNRLPSYAAMCELAAGDKQVSGLLLKERWEEATGGFSQMADAEEEDSRWVETLKVHSKTGAPLSTIDNVWIILEHDPRLKDKFALNAFAGRGEVLGALPWTERSERRLWGDNDNQGLYWYLEKCYQITGTGKIDGALSLHSEKHAFNEVTDYLGGLLWDGTPRLDRLFIDYLGAEDTPYIRAVTRKAFTAAVARAMRPGTKFDNMTILSGPQGIGKSTLLDKMSRGWFNDSIRTFEGKEASELLQGVWIVEIGELDAFRRTDVSRIKQFLSQRADRFRAAYGRHVKEMPRRCVFFGTTNTGDYLQDKTGNRRFWPVDVGRQPAVKSVWEDLDRELDQLWAEAVMRWRLGEPLYLEGALEETARAQQEDHREVSAREGLILSFLEREVPRDWSAWPLDRRRMFWGGNVAGDLELVPRERVCALEIWCELLDGQKKDLRYSDTQEINSVIAAVPGWEKSKNAVRFGYCGLQRGFCRRVTY
ncbi:virulence-associated protein E [Pseudoflavonifractor phocaeensis]|uniref:virulence-associated E family protein n=1 Tax=Pseudoflavonifractor phocaeensis TaxID=1870988 RepID=UPI00195CDF25|nr:virulence-associated E family protein [Pseudoflavonifractor phocaeensis]MBM6938483.1 virulence-associated protein E [Pseudoflavonifractor phocaeensis]